MFLSVIFWLPGRAESVECIYIEPVQSIDWGLQQWLVAIPLKSFGNFYPSLYLCTPFTGKPAKATEQQAALVKGLRRIPFTDESRVRFPYAVQLPAKIQRRSFRIVLFISPQPVNMVSCVPDRQVILPSLPNLKAWFVPGQWRNGS